MANKLIQDLGAGAFALTDLLEHQPIAGPPSLKGDVAALVTLLNTIYAPITGGAYVLKAGDTMTGLLTIAQATANTSNLILSGQSLTGANAQSLLSMTGTWNTSGNPVALRLAITDTASGVTANFLQCLGGIAGATVMFTVGKGGMLTAEGSIVTNSQLNFTGAFQKIVWSGNGGTGIRSQSNGVITLMDNAETDFNRLQFGGPAATYPSIKRSAAIIQARLADDSLFTEIECSNIISNNAGAAFSTNTTLTNFAAAALGTLTNAPTAGNATKWCAFDDNGTTRYFPTWT